MRGVLIVLFALCAGVGSAGAEKVKTNKTTKILSRPGEQAKIILKVEAGKSMTVLAKEGRWIKVRVQGRTGYVLRTKVDVADEDEIVRNTRRRSFVDGRGTRRGFGGQEGPDDRIGADALGEGQDDDEPKKGGDDDEEDRPKKKSGGDDDEEDRPKKKGGDDDEEEDRPKKKSGGDDDEEDRPKKKKGGDDDEEDEDTTVIEEEPAEKRPMARVGKKTKILAERDEDSEPQFTARPSDVLYPTETKGKWTMVENDEGDAGWVLTDELELEDADDDDGGGSRKPKRMIDVGGRLGVSLINKATNTQGSTIMGPVKVPDVYSIGTSAVSVAVGGSVLVPYGKKYLVGGEAAYDYATTVGGVNFMNKANNFAQHHLNLRALAGYPLGTKLLFGRLGFVYSSLQVANVQNLNENTIRLPSEIIKGVTLGAGLWLPKVSNKIGLKFALDAMPVSSIVQTKNLEDGASPSAFGICFGAAFNYKWKKQVDLAATYDLNYASMSFGAPAPNSMRGHTGTNVTRTDLQHLVTFGVAYGF